MVDFSESIRSVINLGMEMKANIIEKSYCSILLTWHRCIISRIVHKIFYLPLTFGIYRNFYRNFASSNNIMKRFSLFYWLVKWLWYSVYNQKVVSSSPRMFLVFFLCVLFCIFTFIRFVKLHYYRCTAPLSNFLWIIIFKRLMRNAYTEPVCLEHLRSLLNRMTVYVIKRLKPIFLDPYFQFCKFRYDSKLFFLI